MITGLGVDILEIARFERSIERSGERLLDRVFTPAEIQYCRAKHHPPQHLAARFAAKEAVSKAMTTGWAGEFRWKDVEIKNDPAGQPIVTLHGRVRELLAGSRILLSISHSDTHVAAVAVIEKGTP